MQNEGTDGRGQQQQRWQKSCARDSQTWKPASLCSLAPLRQRVKAGVPSEAEEDHDEKQRRDGRGRAHSAGMAIGTLPAASFRPRPSLNRPRPLHLGRTNQPQFHHCDLTTKNLKFNGEGLVTVWSGPQGRAIFCAGIRKCISRPTGATDRDRFN